MQLHTNHKNKPLTRWLSLSARHITILPIITTIWARHQKEAHKQFAIYTLGHRLNSILLLIGCLSIIHFSIGKKNPYLSLGLSLAYTLISLILLHAMYKMSNVKIINTSQILHNCSQVRLAYHLKHII